jgi:hypothetical protein
MLFWIIQSTVVSVIFIFLIHTLYEYFKQMYSTPKIKDLVNRPQQDYKEMLSHVRPVTTTASQPVKAGSNTLRDYLKQLKINSSQQPEIAEYNNETSNLSSF